nr:uncharacterized protein LOC112098933 isoform X2 [Ipomoea trifida]
MRSSSFTSQPIMFLHLRVCKELGGTEWSNVKQWSATGSARCSSSARLQGRAATKQNVAVVPGSINGDGGERPLFLFRSRPASNGSKYPRRQGGASTSVSSVNGRDGSSHLLGILHAATWQAVVTAVVLWRGVSPRLCKELGGTEWSNVKQWSATGSARCSSSARLQGRAATKQNVAVVPGSINGDGGERPLFLFRSRPASNGSKYPRRQGGASTSVSSVNGRDGSSHLLGILHAATWQAVVTAVVLWRGVSPRLCKELGGTEWSNVKQWSATGSARCSSSARLQGRAATKQNVAVVPGSINGDGGERPLFLFRSRPASNGSKYPRRQGGASTSVSSVNGRDGSSHLLGILHAATWQAVVTAVVLWRGVSPRLCKELGGTEWSNVKQWSATGSARCSSSARLQGRAATKQNVAVVPGSINGDGGERPLFLFRSRPASNGKMGAAISSASSTQQHGKRW